MSKKNASQKEQNGAAPAGVEMRDPADLRVHSKLKAIPPMDRESPEFDGIVAGVKEVGITAPIPVDHENRVLTDHGRTLLGAAKALQLSQVPVLVREEDDLSILVLQDLGHHRHLSKSAIAILSLPYLQPALERSKARRTENLKHGSSRNCTGAESGANGCQTAEDLAVYMGISPRMLGHAIRVNKWFQDDTLHEFVIEGGPRDGEIVESTFRDWYLPKIIKPFWGGEHEGEHAGGRPMGLGHVEKAINGRLATKDKPRPSGSDQEAELIKATFCRDIVNRWKYWRKLDAAGKRKLIGDIELAVEKLDPEQREEAAGFFERVAQIYKESAKRSQ